MSSPATKWRDSRWLLAFEVATIAAIFYADAQHRLPLSKTPFLFILGWISIRLRGQPWTDVGLKRSSNWARLLFIGLIVGVGMEALELFVSCLLFRAGRRNTPRKSPEIREPGSPTARQLWARAALTAAVNAGRTSNASPTIP